MEKENEVRRDVDVWKAMMLGETTSSCERDAAFLRYYASTIRRGVEQDADIPSVRAAVLEGIAARLDNLQRLAPVVKSIETMLREIAMVTE